MTKFLLKKGIAGEKAQTSKGGWDNVREKNRQFFESLMDVTSSQFNDLEIDYSHELVSGEIILTLSGIGGSLPYTYSCNGIENSTGVFVLDNDGACILKIVDGTNTEIEETVSIRVKSWSAQMADDYIATNDQCKWTNRQRDLIIDRLEEPYIITNFGTKTICDFFIFMETQLKLAALADTSTVTKTGELIRWNFGDVIYDQNKIPAQICPTGIITATSLDGWAGLTVFRFSANHFINNFSGFYYAENIVDLEMSNNKYTHIQTSPLWTKLKWLYIFTNLIESLKTYSTWAACTRIYCYNNRLTEINLENSNAVFDYLYAFNNKFNFTDKLPTGMTGLERVWIYNNKIKNANFQLNSRSISNLYYSGNSLVEIESILAEIKRYFVDGANAPINDLILNVSGGANASIDYAANADYIAIAAHFVANSKTFTVTANDALYEPDVNSYFSYEKVIVDSDFENDRHNAFHTLFELNGRLYCFYREGRSHQSFDANMYMTFSEIDSGIWSDPVLVYDGADLKVLYKHYFDAEPRLSFDIRDFKSIVSADGTILIFGFIGVGYNKTADDTVPADPENIDDRVHPYPWITFLIKMPYNTHGINLSKKTTHIITDDGALSGGVVQKNGVTLATTYYTGGPTSDVHIHRSDDYGVTWELLSSVFLYASHNASNESSLCFDENDVLYATSRGGGANGWMAKSYDYGKTWDGYQSLPNRIDGHTSILLPNGKILWFGRGIGSPNRLCFNLSDGDSISATQHDVKKLPQDDSGYGSVIKVGDKYLFSYGDGKLKPYPNKYGHSNCGSFYVEIDASIIEAL